MAAIPIFIVTYVALALGRIPGLKSDRVAAAIVGAAAMIAFRVLTFEDAERAVDGRTLALLFGMMIISAALDVSGVFALTGFYVMRRAKNPTTLLIAVSTAAAVLSAMMINDVICLAFTPLVLHICDALECEPKPYLIALATSSNIGSVATITGNPQNILIASLSHISYGRFAAALLPVAIVALALNVVIIRVVYKVELTKPFIHPARSAPPHVRRADLVKAVVVGAGVLVAFMAGVPPALAALVGGSSMLLTRATEPKQLYARTDWPLLALFASLFVVVAGIERIGLADELASAFTVLRADTVFGLSGLTALLSNLVSNVPAVMVLKTAVPHLPDTETAWLTLAMASTLAGNLTLSGSLATIIVVERAEERTKISFSDFFKVGAPSAVVSVAFGALWLSLR
ncbi:MAG TPA: anion transporter [Polyangiaceae bacterium]|jgi:Na+/H+ antiporter NhaD/arsenite permease-like protein|nr:anion transporter [Polyangiaceae bacterium]